MTGHEGTKAGGAPRTCTCPASARTEPRDGAPPTGTRDSHTSKALARGPAPSPPASPTAMPRESPPSRRR